VDKPAKEYLGHSETDIAGAAQMVQGVAVPTHTAAQAAIQFVLHHPAISSAVVGISRMHQLMEVVTTIDKPMLSPKDFELLQFALPAKLYELHR